MKKVLITQSIMKEKKTTKKVEILIINLHMSKIELYTNGNRNYKSVKEPSKKCLLNYWLYHKNHVEFYFNCLTKLFIKKTVI